MSVSSLAGSKFMRRLVEPRWLFLPHLMHNFAPAPRAVPSEVLQYTTVRRGTADGFHRLRAACKAHGVTVGGFVAAALTFVGAAVEPAARLGEVGYADRTPAINSASAIAACARRMPLGLSYDINWRERLAQPQGGRMGMLVSFDFIEASFERPTQAATGKHRPFPQQYGPCGQDRSGTVSRAPLPCNMQHARRNGQQAARVPWSTPCVP